MGTVQHACVFLAVGMFIFFSGVTAGKLPKQPETNFEFNCFSDLCTFPIQYCDTDAQYCRYCQTDWCISQNMPKQCRTFCNDYLGQFTSTTTSYITNSEAPCHNKHTDIKTNIALWLICGFLILILFFIVGLVCHFCKRKQNIASRFDAEKKCNGKDGLYSTKDHGSYVEQVTKEGELGNVESCLVDCNLLNKSGSNNSSSDSSHFPNTNTFFVSDSTSSGHESDQIEEAREPLICRPHTEGESYQHEHFGETQIMNKDTLVNVQERRGSDDDSGFRDELCVTTTNISLVENKLVDATEFHRYPVSKVRTEQEEEETQQKMFNGVTE